MSKIVELRGQLEERRTKLATVFEEAGDDYDFDKVTSLDGADSAAKAAQVKALNDEMTDLGKQIDEIAALDETKKRNEERSEVRSHPGHLNGEKDDRKRQPTQTLGEMFIEADRVKGWQKGVAGQVAGIEAPYIGFKATFTTAASTLTGYDRQPGLVMVGNERLTVADLLATAQTTQNTIRYVREDTYTNAATTVAEGAAKPEATFDTSEADAPVRKIAVRARVTDEMFADFPLMRDYIDNRLRFMVAEREEAQLLNGDGIAPNILGILQTPGIQTQAKGADPTADAFYKALVKVRAVGFFEPDGVVSHPNDWTDIRLLRTADGIYIWGHPADPGPERLWGLPVVVTTAMPEGTGLVGAFRLGAQVFYREGIRVESTNSNEDDFNKNLISIRAEQREALAVYRPKAFATVTGI